MIRGFLRTLLLAVPFEDASEIDVVDLRYYNQKLSDLIAEGDYTDVLFLYNVAGFAEDTSLQSCSADLIKSSKYSYRIRRHDNECYEGRI